jgi:hypothetical protein
VYGGTPAGVAAAIAAARGGRNAVLVSFNRHVGGLTSGGLTATDLGNEAAIGGFAREFYATLGRNTGFSSAAAEETFRRLLADAGVTVVLETRLTGVRMAGPRIEHLEFEDGGTASARYFIDATYEGDLFAAAGCTYRVGREPVAEFDESYNGMHVRDEQQFVIDVDPFVTLGDPGSGLLPEISREPAPVRRGLSVPLPELYRLRESIFRDHVSYQQGLLYFLAHDPAVPQSIRDRMAGWGLDPKEFAATGHWPHQLYVREARRLVGEYVMTEHECLGRRQAPGAVGLAAYNMDSHNCQRVAIVTGERAVVRNEGDVQVRCPRPYPIAYRSLTPRRSECENLLVPVCLSATHIAYGSIRMEPVFMILGQSAGIAASLAIPDGRAVQDVAYNALRLRLLDARQVLE